MQGETNLEQSAAAGPFPLCRTAHASFDPENYLKSTEGHIRWKLSDIVEINLKTYSWIQRTKELAVLLTSRLRAQLIKYTQSHFLSYLSNAEILSPTFSSAQLAPQAASAIPLQSQKSKSVKFITKLFSSTSKGIQLFTF